MNSILRLLGLGGAAVKQLVCAAYQTNPSTLGLHKAVNGVTTNDGTVSAGPTGTSAYGVSYSPDGQYLAVAVAGGNKFAWYKRTGTDLTTYTKLTDPATLPTGTAYGVAWSPSGTHVAVAHATTPFVTIYKRTGDTLTKLANPASLPAAQCNGLAWSPDGSYLALAVNASPFLAVYSVSGDTFTKIANPSSLPSAATLNCFWSPNGKYLYFPRASGLVVYKDVSTTYTKVTDSAGVTASGYQTALSPDGVYIATITGILPAAPYVKIHKQTGDSFVELPSALSAPLFAAKSVAFSTDGYLYVDGDLNASGGSSFALTSYKVNGDSFDFVERRVIGTTQWPYSITTYPTIPGRP